MLETISLITLSFAAVPAGRICFQPKLWSCHRLACLFVTLSLTAYGILIATAWYWSPLALPYAALLVLVVTTSLWWRARPGYGARRGFPPGSLSMSGSLRSVYDHSFYLKQARRFGSVFKMSQFHRPTTCITDLALGRDLIRQNEDKLRPPPLRFDRFIPKRYIRFMEEGDHTHYREILKAEIRPELINAASAVIQSASEEQLERMCDASKSSAGIHPMQFMRDLCYDIFPAVFFGLKPGKAELKQLQSNYHRLDDFSLHHHYPDEIEDILCELETIIFEQASAFPEGEKSSPSSILEAIMIRDRTLIEDNTLRRNLLYIMRVTRGDVTGMLNWIWYFIAMEPGVLDTVRMESDPGELGIWQQPATAVDRIIAETLRLEQSEYLYREVLNDVYWNDFHIPRGWLVRVCTNDAHQNADIFPNPERFDPDRFIDRKFSPQEYSPLGIGQHSCLGSHLLFSIARRFIYQLAMSSDVHLVNQGSKTLGGRHWMHWKPGEDFMVNVTPRAP